MTEDTEVQSQVESCQKTPKCYLMPLCIIISIVAIQEKEYRPALYHGVVAIEKGAFGSSPTAVSQLTIYI